MRFYSKLKNLAEKRDDQLVNQVKLSVKVGDFRG